MASYRKTRLTDIQLQASWGIGLGLTRQLGHCAAEPGVFIIKVIRIVILCVAN